MSCNGQERCLDKEFLSSSTTDLFSDADKDTLLDARHVAARMREDQGDHECEVWMEGDMGTEQWNNCKKNPGHVNFISALDFTIDHLPAQHRDKDIFECLGIISELTVRLKVNYVSKNRPDRYPFFNHRGRRISHVGSGMVTELLSSDIMMVDDDEVKNSDDCEEVQESTEDAAVTETTNEEFVDSGSETEYMLDDQNKSDADEDEIISLQNPAGGNTGPCPCRECKDSPTPSTIYWTMDILTAKHVVFDNEEAINTEVGIFVNSEQSASTVKKMSGISLLGESVTEDGCHLKCVTHDKDLYERLHKLCVQLNRKECQMFSKNISKPLPPLCIVISHPHGRPKQVSVGAWTERKVTETRLDCEVTEYKYNAPTCHGSSGAPVFLLGEGITKGNFMAYRIHYHSTGLDYGINASGSWIEI